MTTPTIEGKPVCYAGGLVREAGAYRGWMLRAGEWLAVTTGPTAASCRRPGVPITVLLTPLTPDDSSQAAA